MERTGAIGVARTVLGLLVAGPLLAILAVSVALPPAHLEAAGVEWTVPLLSVVLLVAAAAAIVAWLLAGLRLGAGAPLIAAGASAALAGGAVGWLAGIPAVLAPVAAAAALLASAVVDRLDWSLAAGGRRYAVAGGAVAIAGLVAVLDLLPAVRDAVDPLVTLIGILGVVIAVAAATVGAGRPVGPVAAVIVPGVAAVAVSRVGGFEDVIGLTALATSQLIAVAVSMTTARLRADEGEPDRLPELAEALADPVLRFDGLLRLRDWNPAAAGLLGLDAASGGAHLEDLLGVPLASLPVAGASVSTIGGVGGLRISLQRTGSGLTAVIRDAGASPEAERLGRELRGTIEELLQARRTIELQRQELERASSVDPLTGVASRAAILERLRVEVAQARRYQHSVAVVLLDLDDFGSINRAHGTAGGDAVLREVSLRIRLRVREADELGRVASDAFLAVLPHTDEGGAATFADALQHRLGLRPIAVDAEQLEVTASVGVAVMRPSDDLDVDGLLARVDEALASARRAGGNRIALDRLHGLARLEEHRPPTGGDPPGESGAV